MQAPAPRPAQSFSSFRAQRWVLGAAIVVAMTYALRRFVEPSVAAAPAKGSHAARLAGAGSPPPPLARWAAAYGTGFTMLALTAMAAPELAASLSVLMVTGSLLANGHGIVTDLALLQNAGPSANAPDPSRPSAMTDARKANATWEQQHGLPVILGAPR